jgi:putative thymidine phosphorylase
MKLRVKNLAIATGGLLIAVMHEKDAAKYDTHPMDRIKIEHGKRTETAILDIARSGLIVQEGQVGLYKELTDAMGLANGTQATIRLARKPLSIEYIKKKLDGHHLKQQEFNQIVWDIVHNKLSEAELTYFVAACYTNSLTPQETVYLTKAMVRQGDNLKLNRRVVIDKHCIGGLAGNRTTMVIVPIVAAAGLTIPKTSSRSITSPAGTADTMEVLANVRVPIDRMRDIIGRVGGCIVWGGALNLAPADDKIIKVEKPLSIDAESQLIASIIAKKLSVSSTHILLDIPVGKAAKVKNRKSAQILKEHFSEMAKKLGITVKTIITDGSQPVGNGIGPALEARDVLLVLRNDPSAPADLREKSLKMAGHLLEMGGKTKRGLKMATELLESGRAYEKMKEIIHSQGRKIDHPDNIEISGCHFDIISRKEGIVKEIDNEAICRVARVAGAPLAQHAGIYLHKHVGDKVRKREKVMTVYAECNERLKYAKDLSKHLEPVTVK